MSEPTRRELWLIGQVVDHIGVETRSGARTFLRRAGITAVGYARGASGRPEAQYDAQAVRAAAADRLGRGHRADLEREVGEDDGY